MGRRKKTEAQRRAERFGELYRVGKAKIGFSEEDIGRALGIGRSTLWRKKKELSSGDNTQNGFSFLEMVTLGNLFGWTGEDFASIYKPEK